MKKISNISKIIFFTILMVIICGCHNKRSINTEEFTKIMSQKGYSVLDITEQYKDFPCLQEASTTNSDQEWQIDFYVLDSKEDAEKIYNNNVDTFKALKDDNSKEETVSDKNSAKYTITYNDSYGIVSMIDNTIIYASAKTKDSKTINQILKELGY